MKILMLVSIFFPLFAFSQISTQEQNNRNAGCIPVRDASTGEISRYECDQTKLHAMKSGRMEKLGIQKMKVMKMNQPRTGNAENQEQVDTVEKAMERYNMLKESGQTKLEVEKRPDQDETK